MNNFINTSIKTYSLFFVMVESGTLILAASSVVASILGSLTVVEFRLYREQKLQGYHEKLMWYRKAFSLVDQVHRECTDLNGRVNKPYAQLVENGTLDSLSERVQKLKDHISEAPMNLNANTKYFLNDVWVKYAMLNPGPVSTKEKSPLGYKTIQQYPQAAAEKCRNHLEEQMAELERPIPWYRSLWQFIVQLRD